jgi:DEAD/DEAH box helicase domain-containing protein
VRKAWLSKAFDSIRAAYSSDYPGDAIQDIHGEYVPARIYFDPAQDWPSRLLSALTATSQYRDAVIHSLVEGTPLQHDPCLRLSPQQLVQQVNSINQSEFPQTGLAHALAEAGFLPMYGLPTRVRNLYMGDKSSEDNKSKRTWRTMDRDLDLAIYEFAPGSVLVKDKEQHICVGFTGPIPDYYSRKKKTAEIAPFSAPLADPFWLSQCSGCGAWHRFNDDPSSRQHDCSSCGDAIDARAAGVCRTPNGFRTNFEVRPYDDEQVQPRRHRSISAEGIRVPFANDDQINLRIAGLSQTRTYRLNRGAPEETRQGMTWSGFDVTHGAQRTRRYSLQNQAVADGLPLPFGFQSEGQDEWSSGFWLASEKTTDSLYVAPKAMDTRLVSKLQSNGSARLALRAALLSTAFMLVNRAALELDVDPEEFDIIEPRDYRPDGGPSVPILQVTDHLVNGAGFCARLATTAGDGRSMVARLLSSMVAEPGEYPLRELLAVRDDSNHREECDQACYRCINRYSNQMYHGLLDWRLGMSFARILVDGAHNCGIDGDFSYPELADWPQLARRYAEEMVKFSTAGEVGEFGSLTAFRLTRDRASWALVVHPLWDYSQLPGVIGAAYDALEAAGARGDGIQFIDTFELARRQIAARERLLGAWRH